MCDGDKQLRLTSVRADEKFLFNLLLQDYSIYCMICTLCCCECFPGDSVRVVVYVFRGTWRVNVNDDILG